MPGPGAPLRPAHSLIRQTHAHTHTLRRTLYGLRARRGCNLAPDFRMAPHGVPCRGVGCQGRPLLNVHPFMALMMCSCTLPRLLSRPSGETDHGGLVLLPGSRSAYAGTYVSIRISRDYQGASKLLPGRQVGIGRRAGRQAGMPTRRADGTGRTARRPKPSCCVHTVVFETLCSQK